MIRSLFSFPRNMSASAVIVALPHKIKQNADDEAYRTYVARCLRILTENTAVPSGYYSNGEIGSFLTAEFDEIINPKPVKEYQHGEIANKIKEKMR